MDFLKKAQEKAESKAKAKAQEEADKKTAGLQDNLRKQKDAANNLHKVKTSSGKLVNEFDVIVTNLGHVATNTADITVLQDKQESTGNSCKALGTAVARLNASRVVVKECLETIKKSVGELQEYAGLSNGTDADPEEIEETNEKDTTDLISKIRRILKLVMEVLGQATLIVDREIPSIMENSEKIANDQQGGDEGLKKVKEFGGTAGKIGKDVNDVRKRAMHIKTQVQEIIKIATGNDKQKDNENPNEETSEAKADTTDARNAETKSDSKSGEDKEPSFWAKYCYCCCCFGKKESNNLDANKAK